MNEVKGFLKRYSLVIGIIMMFLLTWPIDLANSDLIPLQVPFAVYIFLGWGFVIASLVMTALTVGREGVIELLKRFAIWRVRWTWYLLAFLLLHRIHWRLLISEELQARLHRTPGVRTAPSRTTREAG